MFNLYAKTNGTISPMHTVMKVVSCLLLGTFEVDEFSFGYLDYQMVVGEKNYLMNDSIIHCGPTHEFFDLPIKATRR